jgi:hypothetical protein
MRKRYFILFLLISLTSVSIFASSSLAVEDEDVTYPSISKGKYPAVGKEITDVTSKEEPDRFKIDFYASAIGGYDTNIYLDHYDATSSCFIQENFGARGRYILSDYLTLRGEYNLASIKYFRESEVDLLDNVIKTGFDFKIMDSLLWSADYILDFVGFPHDKADEYTLNGLETCLRHNITDWFYHKITYTFSHKDYPKWKISNRDGVFQKDDREDNRNTLEHQLGLFLTDKTLIKIENTIYFNNSNELYLDYYDYAAVKTKTTAIQLITDKLYGLVNIGYQYKTFENRNLTDNVRSHQKDHLLMCGTSLFYDIIPNIAIGTNFDYRKNISNEGARKYNDYIISGGLYAKF